MSAPKKTAVVVLALMGAVLASAALADRGMGGMGGMDPQMMQQMMSNITP